MLFVTALFLLLLRVCHSLSVIQMSKDEDNAYHENNQSFSLASYYNDHMVLQAEPYQATIWGYAPEGSEGFIVAAMVSGSPAVAETLVDGDLTWKVTLAPIMAGGSHSVKVELENNALILEDVLFAPMKAGGPHTVKVVLENNTLVLEDVLFGDVWLCSGQSNMEFALDTAFNASYELNDTVNYPDVRVFHVKRNESPEPMTDLAPGGINRNWTVPSPESMGGGKFNAGFSAVCWLYGKYLYQTLQKPIGLVETCWGGTPVEAWSSTEALSSCGLDASSQPLYASHDPEFGGPEDYSVLWNAMINPLKNMTVYGAIWYQGENNAKHNRDLYNCTFPAMIDDWRKQFYANSDTQELFPFGFVQLSGNSPDYNSDLGFADIRWHQTSNHGVVPNPRQQNVFMAVAMDLPDFTSPYGTIHPRDKQDVSSRLALGGLAVGYRRRVSYQGPWPVEVRVSQPPSSSFPVITVTYNMAITQSWLDGFEICCAFTSPPTCTEGKSWWLPTATADSLYTDNSTSTYAMECSLDNVVGLRYAWRDSPCGFKECAIYGANNHLPLPPFIFHKHAFQRQFVGSDEFRVKIE